MLSLLTIYMAAATLASALFLFAGFRAGRTHARELWPSATDEAARCDSNPSGGSHPADVRSAAIVALDRLVEKLRERGTRVDVAIRPGLLVRESGPRLADILERMLSLMAPAADERLLLSAVQQGGQVAIRVASDTPHADSQALRAALGPLLQEMALRPSVLDVETGKEQGVTLLLRLGAAAPASVPERPAEAAVAAAAPVTALKAAARS